MLTYGAIFQRCSVSRFGDVVPGGHIVNSEELNWRLFRVERSPSLEKCENNGTQNCHELRLQHFEVILPRSQTKQE